MPDYKTMYLHLFNAITDSLSALDALNIGQARALLMAAQQQCEELYLDADAPPQSLPCVKGGGAAQP